MNTKIPIAVHDEIEALIASKSSPVGIDAKETHIIIIHKLLEIESRLERIEQRIVDANP